MISGIVAPVTRYDRAIHWSGLKNDRHLEEFGTNSAYRHQIMKGASERSAFRILPKRTKTFQSKTT